MLVSEEQPTKACILISVTDGGMLILVKEEQNPNAHTPIFVTDGGIMVLAHPLINVLDSVCMMALQLSRLS